MVVMNKNSTAKSLAMDHYSELVKPGARLMDVLNDKTQVLGNTLDIPAKTAMIYEIQE